MQKTSIVSIIGRPNAGKSTLLNHALGQKISIVSPKVQTTRSAIRGILTEGDSQLVFIDTPGIFNPKKNLEKVMVRSAWSSLAGSDTICIIIDFNNLKSTDEEFAKILDHISKVQAKKVIIFNKIDRIDRIIEKAAEQGIEGAIEIPVEKAVASSLPDVLPALFQGPESDIIKYISKTFPDDMCFFISALKSTNVSHLLDYLREISPVAPFHYEEDEVTDAPMKFLCSEITREKLFLKLSDELPYNLMVDTEKWDQISPKEVKIYQNIIVNKDSHKMIILGKGGKMIKEVGMKARKEISEAYNMQVHLFLFVKVREDWDSKLK